MGCQCHRTSETNVTGASIVPAAVVGGAGGAGAGAGAGGGGGGGCSAAFRRIWSIEADENVDHVAFPGIPHMSC